MPDRTRRTVALLATALLVSVLLPACTSAPDLEEVAAEAGVEAAGDADLVTTLAQDPDAAGAVVAAQDGWAALLGADADPTEIAGVVAAVLEGADPEVALPDIGAALADGAGDGEVAVHILAAVVPALTDLSRPDPERPGATSPAVGPLVDGVVVAVGDGDGEAVDRAAVVRLVTAAGLGAVAGLGGFENTPEGLDGWTAEAATAVAGVLVPLAGAMEEHLGAATAETALRDGVGDPEVLRALVGGVLADGADDVSARVANARMPRTQVDDASIPVLLSSRIITVVLHDPTFRAALDDGVSVMVLDEVPADVPEHRWVALEDGSVAVISENVWEKIAFELRRVVGTPVEDVLEG